MIKRFLPLAGAVAVASVACSTAQPSATEVRLQKAFDDNPYGSLWRKDLTTEQEVESAVRSLQENLTDRFPGSSLDQCEDVVQLAVGVVGGNFVYGADCMVQGGDYPVSAVICADEMVGYFALLESGLRPSTLDEIADWTYANCGQGG